MQRFPLTYWLLSVGILFYLFTPKPSAAQIVPDATLPKNSIVTPNCTNCEITGGTTVGNNLFHSFQQFSIPTGGTAYFNNTLTVENIISRVTGKSISNIDGLIHANGTANLFLLNPNGIIFGPNASLNIGGSFLASTGSSLKFADGKEFSASSPQTTPLLTISVPIGLQYEGNTGSILNQSQANNNSGQVVGLQVKPEKSLALVGGNVKLDGGLLQVPNGRVELGGVAGAGTVGLQVNGNNFSLSFPVDVEKADVLLTNGAKIDVADIGSGSVGITARNLNIEGGSSISGGIKSGLTSNGSVPGDITLNATGLMRINQESLVDNGVPTDAKGNGGDINVYANRFELTDDGRLRTRTLGKRRSDAGDINIKAGDIYIKNPAYVVPIREVLKETNNPALEDKPALDASNYKNDNKFGKGRSGNISLEANGSISLIGEGVENNNKVISSYNGGANDAMGSGNISLKAKSSISLSNAFLTVSNNVRGDVGNILLQGDKSVSLANDSGLAASNYGKGNSGNITLQSFGSVSLDSSLVSTNIGTSDQNYPPAQGNAGNIYINGQSVFVTGGSTVTARTFNSGNSGNIQVNATDRVEIFGINPLFSNPKLFSQSRPQSVYSALVTNTGAEAKGRAGNIVVNTGILRIVDGASFKAETLGAFAGGDIAVNARIVELTGGAKILSSTLDKGNAGNITLNVSDRLAISGTNPNFEEIFKQVVIRSGLENAQRRLGTVGADSGIYVNSQGSGQAGNLTVTARSILLDNQGKLVAESNSVQGGDITLKLQDLLLLRHGSSISTSAGTARGGGNGGNITINAPNGFIVAVPDENSDISANAYTGKGGNVRINMKGIFGIQRRERPTPQSSGITASSELGINGTVQINTPDVDPSRGLVQLPAELVNVEVAQGCQAAGKQASVEFFNIGRGGLAPNPYEPLSSSHIWEDVPIATRDIDGGTQERGGNTATPVDKIVEAQGWRVDEKGEVTLVAEIPSNRSQGRCRLR